MYSIYDCEGFSHDIGCASILNSSFLIVVICDICDDIADQHQVHTITHGLMVPTPFEIFMAQLLYQQSITGLTIEIKQS